MPTFPARPCKGHRALRWPRPVSEKLKVWPWRVEQLPPRTGDKEVLQAAGFLKTELRLCSLRERSYA